MFGKKHKDEINNKECLKCQYDELFKQGKQIFDAWDQVGQPPKQLLLIQKQLLKLKKQIEKDKIDEELEYCADHPEIYEYLPIEWT